MANDPNPDPPTQRVYLTRAELAARSGLSDATVQRYKAAGRIPFFQPGGKGGRVLFPLDAIESAHRELATDRSARTYSVEQHTSKLPGPSPRWQINPPSK